MPYRLVHFSPGLVQVEVNGHIETSDVDAMRDESELMLRHVVEPFDVIVDARDFTGLNPLALAGLKALPLPAQLRAVAVILSGWQRLAARALPHIDGLHFVGSLDEAEQALTTSSPLAVAGADQRLAERAVGEPTTASSREPQADEPLPQVRRLPTRPLPPAHRRPGPEAAPAGPGSVLRGLARQMQRVSRRLEQIID